MNPKNVCSTLLLGHNLDYVLFKTAIHYAENGLHIWFISPEPFEKLPKIEPPDKEVLKLITFLYFKDYKDLIMHLNGLHLWHKVPNVIILRGLETYSKIYNDDYNATIAGLISSTLLDGAAVCSEKTKLETFLIATTFLDEKHKKRLQILHDMYFLHIINESEDTTDTVKEIIHYFQNKK